MNVDFSLLEPTDYTQTEILVRFNESVDISDLGASVNLPTFMTGPLGEGFRADSQLFEIPVMPGQSVPDLVDYYNSIGAVDYAEPNYLMETTAVPNDQYFNLQWGPTNTNAESAWDTRTDSSSVIVGVIDSGVQYNHPDLQNNIWTNPGEIAGNGIDDDGNGYVDDFYGYDFDNDDNDPMDDHGHGTHVAGTIGAEGNNSIGVAGIGWNANMMSLKVIGNGSNADVARAIDYATDNGAKITNNSYGYAGTNVGGSQVMSDAIGRAKNAGVLYVVAAGNSRTNIPASDMDGNFNSWPAEYSKVHDNVITVAAIDEDGSFASYSHWGDQSVQIAAPGTQIASTYNSSNYVYNSGTSMAAPHVAGAAALLWAERPDMTYLEIKAALLDTARAEHLTRVSHGVMDLGAAMASIVGTTNDPPNAVNDSATLNEDGSAAISVLANDTDPENDTLTVSSFTQPSNGSVTNSSGVLTYTPSPDFNGSDSFTYTIDDGNGNSDSATVSLTVNAVNDAPTLANGIADVTVDENAADSVVDLTNTFADVDNTTLTLSVQANTNSSLVSTSITGNDLTLSYAANQSGSADITVRATDAGGLFVEDTFTVTVNPAGSGSTQTFTNTTDVIISSSGTPTVTSDIVVSGMSGTITDVNLELDITHTWVSDLDVTLIAPDGTRVNLFTDVGGSGDNFTNTVLDDEAASAINSASAPFTGTFRPENDPLSNLDGKAANGTWTLEIHDDYNADGGQLNDWSITISTESVQNQAPNAVNDSASTTAGNPVTTNVLANDTDPDGDTLSVQSVTQAANGTVVNNNDGTVTYTPNAGFTGSDSYTYTVDDGNGLTDSATVNVTVSASQTQTFSNTTDVAISSSGTPTITSDIVVSGMGGTISDLNLAFDITHTWVADLDVTLISPNGTRINLFTDIGGSANNFTNTVLDDEAATAINTASAPFTGTFRPENDALSTVDGEDPNGTWQLEISDDANQDGGQLNEWSITITTG